MTTSKMQTILDQATTANESGDVRAAVAAIIDAIKLLSRGQQQVMQEINRQEFSPTDTRIGGE